MYKKYAYTLFYFCSFGRKYTTMIFWIGTSSCSFAITVAYFVAAESNFKVYTNVFALMSRLSLSAAWQSLLLFTIEAFPTVVRYVISEAAPEAVAKRCSVKRCSQKFHKTHRKTPVSETCNLVQVFSCGFCEISKNTFSHRTSPVAASAAPLGFRGKYSHRKTVFELSTLL